MQFFHFFLGQSGRAGRACRVCVMGSVDFHDACASHEEGYQHGLNTLKMCREHTSSVGSVTHAKPGPGKRHKRAVKASQRLKEQWASVFYDWNWGVMIPSSRQAKKIRVRFAPYGARTRAIDSCVNLWAAQIGRPLELC